MTAAASLVLPVLQAHPGSPAWRLAEVAGLPVTETLAALSQLAAAGLAHRADDEHGVVIWYATAPERSA